MKSLTRRVSVAFCLYLTLGIILPGFIYFFTSRLFVEDHGVLFVAGEDTHYEPSFHHASLNLTKADGEISAYIWNDDERTHLFITPADARNILLVDNKIVFDSAIKRGENIRLPRGLSFVKLVVKGYRGVGPHPDLLRSTDFVKSKPIEEQRCYVRERSQSRIFLERLANSAGFIARLNLLFIPLLLLIRPATGFRSFFKEYSHRIWLILAVAIMFWLRFAGIDYQMQETIHPDENLYGNMIDQILTGKFAPSQLWYTTGYLFLVAATDRFMEWLFGEPMLTIVSQRALSALFSCLTCLLVYWAGKFLFSKRIGIIAVVLFGFSFLPIEISHYGIVEPTVVFFFTLAFVFQIMLLQRCEPIDFIKSGVCAGLSMAMKQSAFLILIPFISVVVLLIRDKKIRKMGLHELPLWIVGAASAFFLFSPSTLLEFSRFHQYQLLQVRVLQGITNTRLFIEGSDEFFGSLVLESARLGFGYPLIAAAAVGVVLILRKHKVAAWILLPFTCVYILILCNVRILPEHYLLLLAPFIALFAAVAISSLHVWQSTVRKGFVAGLVILLLAPSINRVYTFQRLLHSTDTRRQAEEWCYKNLPPGANITYETFGPRFLIPVFGVRPILLFRRPSWEQYLHETHNGYYVEDSITEKIYLKSPNAFPVEMKWRENLRKQARIVKEFHGEKFLLLNPDIRIYKLPQSEDQASVSVSH